MGPLANNLYGVSHPLCMRAMYLKEGYGIKKFRCVVFASRFGRAEKWLLVESPWTTRYTCSWPQAELTIACLITRDHALSCSVIIGWSLLEVFS